MIIILEGMDGSGKTTLKEGLPKLLGLNCIEYDLNAERRVPTKPSDENRVDSKTLYKRLLIMACDNVVHVMDRSPISDIVYRVVDKETSVWTTKELLEFLHCYNTKVFVVYCKTPNSFDIMCRRGDDNENIKALANYNTVSKAYDIVMDAVFNSMEFNYATYDWEKYRKRPHLIKELRYFVAMNCGKSVNSL